MQSASQLPAAKTAIGYVTNTPDPAVPLDTVTIPEKHRLHAMVVGASGYGKSTVLKMLILQNLIRGEGVAIFDPHHDLAAWAARRIPKWRANHLVYISPAQLMRTHKAVPINPLEAYGGAPGTAATSFTETLMKAYDTSGVRMEQLLTQAATSLIASGRGGLGLLRRMIIDKSERDAVLANVHLRDNLDYWENVFPHTAKEAVPAVDNKLTPIISNPGIGPFFEGDTIFDMARLIGGNGILIFDGAGCNSDSERMIFTTFLLNMVTTAASKLAQARPQGVQPNPFYVYVDEMQMLESDKLQEMLQQVRKWGIRMTLATQQLESIDAKHAAAMIGNCDLYMVSRCTPNSAKMLAPKMGVNPDELTKIPKFHMNYHMSVPDGDIHGKLLRTRDMDRGTHAWETLDSVVDHSLVNYGVEVDMTKYTNEPEHAYDVSPLETAVMAVLFYQPDGLRVDDVHSAMERFAVDKRRVAQVLNNLIRQGLGEAISGEHSTTYKLRPEAVNRYFDTAALKGRAGGDLHINTLTAMQEHYSRRGYFTKMDVGDTTAALPDLEVCEPAVGPEGALDPSRWGRRISVELETGPGRHPNKPGKPGQVYKNWLKSHANMTVWFLVYGEKDRQIINTQLSEMGVSPAEYRTTVISAKGVEDGTAIPVPPGFVPADPLPFCTPHSILDKMVLNMVTGSGVMITEIPKKVPTTYNDKDVANVVDRLKEAGKVRTERRKDGVMLFPGR